jgi:hypothetical protein
MKDHTFQVAINQKYRERSSQATADANRYTAVYGEDNALRTIEAGLARGALLPLPEPIWYGERPL